MFRPPPSTSATPLPSPTAAATCGNRATAGASRGLVPLPPAPDCRAPTATSPAKERETVRSIVVFREAPKTVNSDTTATPVISAVAVAAVRPGLRSALRRASRAGDPAQPVERRAQDPYGVRGRHRAQDHERGDGEQQVGAREHPGDGHPDSGGQQGRARRLAGAGGARLVDGALAQRGERRGPVGPQRGQQRRAEADEHTDGDRQRDGEPADHQVAPGESSEVKRSRKSPVIMSRLSAAAASPVMASTPLGSTGVSASTS